MDSSCFDALPARFRALVAVAVLLDGREAAVYLQGDATHGTALRRAADELSAIAPDMRMPMVGTLLRVALKELRQ